jgi:hypothetical protein
MILGMSFETFSLLHTVISLIGIATGLVALAGMLAGKLLKGWTGLFLLTTVLTTVTGFLFPISVFTPAIGVGIVSSVILVIALAALYVFHLAGAWRPIYVITAIFALYLNSFVGVVQAFQKVSFLQPLAPTQSEPPFLIAQGVVFVGFIIADYLAVKRFHPAVAAPA